MIINKDNGNQLENTSIFCYPRITEFKFNQVLLI